MKSILSKTFLLLIFFLASIITCKAQTWDWAKSGDGTGADEGYAVTTDIFGNVFITGGFTSSTISFGSYTLASSGSGNIYLAKYNSTGSVLWAKSPFGTNTDLGLSVSTDTFGNVFVTGYFSSSTLIFDTYTLTNAGGGINIFLAKYAPNGNVLWAKSAIGSGINNTNEGLSVCTGGSGNVFITGYFTSPTISFDTFTLTNSGNYDVFLAKYDSNGNVLWAKGAGGNQFDVGHCVSIDANENAFVTGYFNSPSITFGATTFTTQYEKIFLTKYDLNGNIQWAKNAGGTNGPILGGDLGYSVSTDITGNAYVTGSFYDTNIAFGATTLTNVGYENVFLTKYDANGNETWAKSGRGTANGFCVSTDASGAFISGKFTDTLVLGTYTLIAPLNSPDPMFIAKYDITGNVIYAEYLPSGGDDQNAISTDKFCNAYISGDFYNSNPFIIGTNSLTQTGGENIFVAKLSFTSTNCVPIPDNVSKLTNPNFQISIFPNPNNGSFKIQMDKEINNGELILINSLGQKVYEQKIIKGENEIIFGGLSSGLYHYIISQNKVQIGNGKMIVE